MAVESSFSQIEANLFKIGKNNFSDKEINFFKVLKSGQDIVCESFSEDEMILTTCVHCLLKVDANLYELMPRALIFCNEIDTCEILEDKLNKLSYNRDLKTVIIHDKADSVKQRNVLYEGVDIVIGNPKRIGELYFQNGINLKNLKLFIVLEGFEIALKGGFTYIQRLNESLPRCQKIVFYKKEHEKLNNYLDSCLVNPRLV